MEHQTLTASSCNMVFDPEIFQVDFAGPKLVKHQAATGPIRNKSPRDPDGPWALPAQKVGEMSPTLLALSW